MRSALALFLMVHPALADPLACRAPGLTLSVEIAPDACIINGQAALRREKDGLVVCLLSNPQLRIITFAPDGGFTYEDTDADRHFAGRCG